MSYHNDLIEQSSKTYSKIFSMFEEEFGIQAPPAFSSGERIDQLRDMAKRLQKLSAQRAAAEAVFRIFQLVANSAHSGEHDIHWPQVKIRINEGNAGMVMAGPFNSARSGTVQCDDLRTEVHCE